MIIFEGYLVGLALVVLIGPVLFVLLGVTLENGRGAGLAAATGIMVSDVIAVGLCAVGLAGFFTNEVAHSWMALAGGVILLGLSVQHLFFKKPPLGDADVSSVSSVPASFVKGFMVNFVNPFVFLVWIGIIAGATARHGTGAGLLAFLGGSIAGVFTMDILKVVLAERIRPLLGPGAYCWVFRVSGVLMGIFGARMLFSGFL